MKILNKDIEETAASMTSINFWSVGVSIAACNGRLFLQVCVKYNLCFVLTAKIFLSLEAVVWVNWVIRSESLILSLIDVMTPYLETLSRALLSRTASG